MSSCDESSIKKNYIVQSPTDFDILSACTGFYTNNIYNCTGDTLTLHSTTVSANTVNASVYLSGGTNLLDIFGSLDNYTTGATLVGTEVVFDRTNLLSAYTLNLSTLVDNNTFVTGFTYDDANTFTISDNSGSTFNATFNTVTGLTVTGGLSATTLSACTGIYTSNLYGCSPITVHDSIQSSSSSATGLTSFAFGTGAQAYGDYSHAEGKSTTAIGENSHAEGNLTTASGKNSHAEGLNTTAGGFYSHAEGSGSETIGTASHAEGLNTTASNQGSHAEGGSTTASGLYSHAEGKDTTASGHYSHAGGRGINSSQIVASGETSFVHFRVATGGGFGPNHGAYGDYSAILGGNDHNIGYGSTSSGIFAGSDNIINDNVLRSVILGGSNITGTTDDTVYVPNLNVNLIDNDDSLTQILSRDSSDGTIKYRDVSSIIGAASADTFVTGFTYDGVNTFTISDNSGSTFNTSINVLSATTISATTYFGDGSNLSGIDNFYVSGGSYNDGTTSIDFSGNSVETTFSVSLSGISSNIDIYNTYFVSPTGDDSTAVRGDLHNPFKTITAARNKVVAELSASTVTGDTLIYVYPGNYTDQEVQYENGNFYFTPNTVVTLVQNTTANRTDVFRLGTSLVNTSNIYSANTCNIYGQAKFIVSASTDNDVGGGVIQMLGNSKSHFECDSAYGSKGTLFSTFGNSELKLKANELELEANDYVLTFRESSKTFIDVNRIKGGTLGWAVYYFGFNGQSILNVDELVGGKTFQPLGFRSVSDGAEIVLNINKLSHEPNTLPNTQWLINNTSQSGGKITYNGNMNGVNGGIIYGTTASGGEFNYNGDILVGNIAILQGFPGVSSTDHKFNFNGTISVSGNSTTPTLFNGGTITLNGSLLDLGGTGTNGISTTSSTDLRVDNFRVEGVTTNSIIGSGNVDIFNSLYIDKPIGGTVTTTGQYIFTGTTYDGDLNIYNTPTNDNLLTEILGRNSSTGDVEYRDVQSIISAATSQDTFVTGYTYDDANTFTISDNSGSTFSATINNVTGLTVNGDLSATTISACTGIYTSNLYGCSPITVNDNLILLSGLTFPSITQDNSLTQILSRDSSDGTIKYRDVQSIISAATSQDTFVTGFTYDNINTFTISDNSGSTFNASINVLSATTISATTFYGDGSQLSGITHTTDTFISGGTYIDGGIGYNSNSIDLDNNTGGTVTITSVRDTYLTGQTFNESNYEITSTLNDGTSLISDLSILSTDMVVTGGTYDINNGVVTFTNNSGGTFNVSGFTSGMTDSFTVAANISASTESITFDNNLTGSNFYNVSLTPLLSGKTNNSTFNTYTSDTQTILDSKVEDGANVGSGAGEIFSGKSGTTLNFRTLSGGSNTTLTTVGDVVKIDVAVPSGDNFFSTAGTVTQSATTGDTAITLQIVGTSGFSPYSITGITDTFVNDFTFSSNTFTITQNDGSSFDSSLETIELGNILSAVTFNIGTSGSISATTFNGDTFSGGTFYGDGTNLSGIDNFYVTGGTVTGETTIVLSRTDNVNVLVTGVTGSDLFNTYTGNTETVLLTKVDGGNNVGGATEIFRDKTGTTLNFRTLSGGTNTTVTTIGDVNRVDVSLPTDLNTFVTGFTYNDNNTFTINDNVGSAFTATINQVSGLTVNGTLSATTLDGGIILSGGTNLTTIIESLDTYVTGGTVSISATTNTNSATIGLSYKNSEGVPHTLPFDDTFTTGATYDNGTALVTFDKNDGTNYFLNLSTIDVNDTFVSGGTYNDSTDIITFTNTSGGTFNVTGITDTFVTGGTYSSGTTSLDFSGNTGFVPFSVNVSELIDDTNTFVTGFTYNDTNTFTISNNNGTNYSASIDIMSGLTVNGDILWGDPTALSLNTTVKKSINSGLSEIYSIPVSAYTGGFFEYTVTGSGARAGSIMSIFSGTSIDFNETTTNDIGDTSGITFDMNISGGTANLTVSATTNSWEIKTIVRSI